MNSKRVRRAEGDEASGASQKESTTSRGGLRGLLSSARSSLGWGKGHREQEDDKVTATLLWFLVHLKHRIGYGAIEHWFLTTVN